MPPTNQLTHSVDDVARRYAVGQKTVLEWIRAGDLLAVDVSRSTRAKKKRLRITAAALEAFEAARTTAPAPQAVTRRRSQANDGVIQFYK